jgi:hypothetical protein
LAALATTPIDLIAAQGAGLAIDINRLSIRLAYGTAAYDFGASLSLTVKVI